jgi:hypothetical protein
MTAAGPVPLLSKPSPMLSSVTAKNRRNDKIMGALPDPMPWAAIAGPWAHAEDSLARLDQTLAMSDVRDAWVARADVAEAAASVWLDGGAVAIEDLVLHDADTASSLPTPALFKARSVLLARRTLERPAPADVLTVPGILELHGRRRRQEAALTEGDPGAADRIAAWLRLTADLASLPALPAAVLAFHAWSADPPVRHGGGVLGRLLIPVMLRARGKTRHHALAFAVGLQTVWPRPRRGTPPERGIADILDAIANAAAHGLEAHHRLMLAKTALARPLAGRRRSSHLAALAALILRHPVISAPMAARHLGLSQRGATLLIDALVRAGCVRERTGRTRYRAFSLS